MPHGAEFEDRAMPEVTATDDRPKRRSGAARRDRDRMVPDDVVTPNSLATHLGMSRQNVARLTAEAIIEQRSDGNYDQTASRLKYIKHLREHHRHTPRSAADVSHIGAKTEMLQLKLAERRRELMPTVEHNAMIDAMAGLVLTHLGGWPARIGGADLGLRRRADALLRELRVEISQAASAVADAAGEPPDEQ
jgi:hypothetical protein